MKNKMLLFIITLFTNQGFACDICGCGAGGSYIGILPDFSKHIAGLRYRSNTMTTHLGVDGAITYLTTQEQYNTTEAWGGWTIGEKVRLMATIPYGFNEKTNQGITKRKNGIGDITASAFYQLINNRKTVFNTNLLMQSLWLGGGIKLPTGKYSATDTKTGSNDANLFQLGTGSYDFNLTAMYDIRLQDAGINLMGNYRITTANGYNYQYGNKCNINVQAYYKFRIASRYILAPNTGIQYETAQTDLYSGFDVAVSGGNILMGTIGVETVLKKISLGANYRPPLSQQLAKGIIKADGRWMAHLSYIF